MQKNVFEKCESCGSFFKMRFLNRLNIEVVLGNLEHYIIYLNSCKRLSEFSSMKMHDIYRLMCTQNNENNDKKVNQTK